MKSARRRVVLAGCGHAHLEVMRRAPAFAARSCDLALVDPGRFWYSGRGSGVLGGRFTEDEATVDPAALARAYGVAHHTDRLAALDRRARIAVLDSGERLGYDLLSFNIGSRVGSLPILVDAEPLPWIEPVKPIAGLLPLRTRILQHDRGLRIVVLGAGATGLEIAGNLLHLSARHALDVELTLVGAAAELLPGAPAGLRRAARYSLIRRGATLRLGSPAVGLDGARIRLSNGDLLPFDLVIVATGLAADPLVASLGLPHRGGGLRVRSTLQSTGDPCVFAAGDCAAIEGHDLPKVGVYGVRAGPVLARNLLAALDGRSLEPFRPQRRYLSILDLADGAGLAMRGRLWFGGRAALWLKTHLDGRFLSRYRKLDEQS